MLTLSQYATKYDINIHTLRSWVKKGKIDGATLQNNKWYIPDVSINNTDEAIDNPIDTTTLELLIKEKDERITSLENQIKHLQEQNKVVFFLERGFITHLARDPTIGFQNSGTNGILPFNDVCIHFNLKKCKDKLYLSYLISSSCALYKIYGNAN